jgi:hypothetical protein
MLPRNWEDPLPPAEFRNRLSVPSGCHLQLAELVVGINERGVELERPLVIRLRHIALAEVRNAYIGVCVGSGFIRGVRDDEAAFRNELSYFFSTR